MYESPITQIMGEMTTKYEDDCLKVVQSYGFTVNKEELTKALQYDRGQYLKGYGDGYEKAIDDFAEQFKSLITYDSSYDTLNLGNLSIERMINYIAEELKGNKGGGKAHVNDT